MFKDKQENLSLPLVENSSFPQREVTKKPDQKCWNLKLQEREYYLQIKVFYSRNSIWHLFGSFIGLLSAVDQYCIW